MKGKNIQKNLLLGFIKNKKAFTLVEAIITIVIIVVVFVSGLKIFSSIIVRISKQSAEKTITSQASDFILFLRHKLKEAIINDIEGNFRIDFVGTETSIKFVAPYSEGEGSDLGKYGIVFDGNEIKLSFERIDRRTKTYSFEPGFTGSQVMVENVSLLSFAYWDGEKWQKSWNTQNQIGQASLPEKIKVFFILGNEKIEGKKIEKAFKEEIWLGQ